jgi:hypothetical protein
MNTEALFLFLILLLGLVLCSFLGGNCEKEGFTDNNSKLHSRKTTSEASTSSNNNFDNYNHYTGNSTQLSSGATFYGDKGTTAVVVNNSDGTQSLQITLPGKSEPITFSQNNSDTTNVKESYTNYYGAHGTATKFYGPNGETATIVNANNGQQAIKVETSDGVYYYNVSGNLNNNNTDTSTQYYGSTGYPIQQSQYALAVQGGSQYYGPYGGSATSVTGPYGNTAFYAEGPNGNSISGVNTNSNTNYYGPYGGSATSVTGPYGNTAFYAEGPNGNSISGVNTNSNTDYYNTLPPGIPRNQIPPGKEDLYILKSEVVPPVCPACPVSAAVVPRQESCPPCPACARCPEPSFECKKVPNYNAINNEYLPAPVLNDFSQFGM